MIGCQVPGRVQVLCRVQVPGVRLMVTGPSDTSLSGIVS